MHDAVSPAEPRKARVLVLYVMLVSGHLLTTSMNAISLLA